MAMSLRGPYGEAKYGFRVATRFRDWELEQDDGDPGVMIEATGDVDDDEFFGSYQPTELRLRLGERWMVYRIVARVSDTQWRAEGKAEVQTL